MQQMETFLQRHYRASNRVDDFTYRSDESSVAYLSKIYNTFNLRFAVSAPPIKPASETMPLIWASYLAPLYHNFGAELAKCHSGFDDLMCGLVAKIADTLRKDKKDPFPIGYAQKITNLFFKDLWALDRCTQAESALFHATLDARVLAHVKAVPASWKAWTKAAVLTPSSTSPLWVDYMTIQARIQDYADSLGISRVMVEQLWWAPI